MLLLLEWPEGMHVRGDVHAGYVNGCPCVRVWRWVLGEQPVGRWLHTLLGTGTECVQRHAGTCVSLWAMCRPLGCENGLRSYRGVDPRPQHPWLSTACGWLGWAGASRDSTLGLKRVHRAPQTPLTLISAPPYWVARADLQAARG